jgi:hypothetical protein
VNTLTDVVPQLSKQVAQLSARVTALESERKTPAPREMIISLVDIGD